MDLALKSAAISENNQVCVLEMLLRKPGGLSIEGLHPSNKKLVMKGLTIPFIPKMMTFGTDEGLNLTKDILGNKIKGTLLGQ